MPPDRARRGKTGGATRGGSVLLSSLCRGGASEGRAQRDPRAAARRPEQPILLLIVEQVVHVDLQVGVVAAGLEVVMREQVHRPARRGVEDDGQAAVVLERVAGVREAARVFL